LAFSLRLCVSAVKISINKMEYIAMTINRIVHIFAGFFVLLSLALGVQASPLFVNVNFLWFTAFVGANLFQSGFTNFCPLVNILKALGVKEDCKSC